MGERFYKYHLGDSLKTLLINGWLYIKLEITAYCNFKCSYCCVSAPFYKTQEFELNRVNFHNVISFLKAQGAPGLIIELFGGEPTIHPDIIYFIDELKKHFEPNLKFILMTNLSGPLELYESLPSDMEVVVGFHSKYYKIDHYIKKATVLSRKFTRFISIVLLHEENADTLIPELIKLKESNLEISILPLANTPVLNRVEYEGYDDHYNESEAEVIDESGRWLGREEAMKHMSFTGMFCFPNINVKANGRVEICTQKDTHILKNEKVRNMVLCSKIRCNECERANPKISIKYAKEKNMI